MPCTFHSLVSPASFEHVVCLVALLSLVDVSEVKLDVIASQSCEPIVKDFLLEGESIARNIHLIELSVVILFHIGLVQLLVVDSMGVGVKLTYEVSLCHLYSEYFVSRHAPFGDVIQCPSTDAQRFGTCPVERAFCKQPS